MLFSFIAAADFSVASAKTLADLEHILMLLKIGGGFGMLGVVCGWSVFLGPLNVQIHLLTYMLQVSRHSFWLCSCWHSLPATRVRFVEQDIRQEER